MKKGFLDKWKNISEIKRIEGIIEQQKRFNQERNYITIASKEKQIERIKADLIVPDKALSSVRFSFNSEIRSGDNVLTVFDLEKSFPQKPLFKNFNLSINREDKMFLSADAVIEGNKIIIRSDEIEKPIIA